MSDANTQRFLDDAAVYKHAVLGLIFLKYVSDAFDLRREELISSFKGPESEYYSDWQVRENVRVKMRPLIKRLLRKYKYPPEGQNDAVRLALQQAKSLTDAWSAGA